MSVAGHTEHYDEEMCWAYALDALEPDAAAELERHMADCEECAMAVGGMIDKAKEARRWNAALHGRAWRRERLRVRLTEAVAAARGGLREALRRWVETGAAFGEGLTRATFGLPPVPALAGVPTRRPVRTRGGLRPEPGGSVQFELPDGTRGVARIEDRNVVLRFSGRSRSGAPLPVLLAPEDEAEAPQAVLADWDDLRREWVAKLPLPRGEFEVLVGQGPG
jgi:hypothetical protein